MVTSIRAPIPKMGLATSTPALLAALLIVASRAARDGAFALPVRLIIARSPSGILRDRPSVAVIGAAQVVLPRVRIAVFGMPTDIHLGDDHATDIRSGGFED